ncbi:MAG TPA: STAS domain-containing protein [Acidimicrobiales bacterium]
MIEIQTCTDGRVKLRPFGDFTWTSAVSLRHLVHDAICQELDLTIDLSRVEGIDAAGLSALVGSIRRARSAGGTAQVINARPRVTAVFELAGVKDLLIRTIATADDVA